MNGGHYSTASDYQLIVRMDWSEQFAYAAQSAENLRSHQKGRAVNHDQPDLAVLANSINLPARPPQDGSLDFPVTVANLGEAPSQPMRLVMKAVKEVLAQATIPYLPPGEEKVVTFRLQGTLAEVQFQLEQATPDFDPSNDVLLLHLWAPDEQSRKQSGQLLTDTVVSDVPIDRELRVDYKYDSHMRFVIAVVKDPAGKAFNKRLTFSANGNTTLVSVDGKGDEFGGGAEKWLDKEIKLPTDPAWQDRDGTQSSWCKGDIRFTQMLTIIPGKQPIQGGTGEAKRQMDTCLVRYRLENLGNAKHAVGMRAMLDTLLGGNDGVPFTVPGLPDLVKTSRDFRAARDVPDLIQALERPNLRDPGTVAHLSLRLAGLESPQRASLTRWPGASLAWELPVQDIGGDSAVLLDWPERDFAPGEQRKLGFCYGLSSISPAGLGKLALGVEGAFQTGKAFTLIAYVNNPATQETIELKVPDGLELVQGAERRQWRPIPTLATGTKTGNTLVTWRVRALRPGTYTLLVRRGAGAEESRVVVIGGTKAAIENSPTSNRILLVVSLH